MLISIFMFDNLTKEERTIAIQRLTALWALNECGLGGILHAVKSPFTGLVLGSIAMSVRSVNAEPGHATAENQTTTARKIHR